MTSIPEGATIWARQTLESDVFSNKPDKWFKIWFYLINKVNHKDNQKFNRGQAFIKYEWIQESTKATKNQIDHFMRWAKGESMLATQKATRGMMVTILNYDHFQTLDNYKSDTESELKAKQKRNRSDTINKNEKNEKNEKNNKVVLLPEWLDPELWKDFKDHRKKLGKPMTERAGELVIKKAEFLKGLGHNPRHLMLTAIESGWQTVYEPKS